ncbi:N-acetylmuramoyl-L-alanine amidase [Luteipulveratus mongoliensis]|uniref:MurNAc-LAA domain-containing protein n=1 Tax=Luteipulveratus mongoliensis TaxID=571913 RepID=A0A0K1JGL0_9MICO|nr:N-acetylmuramoyl-L-alanine amidase [Luteipulveratus mongoliensis]AKU15846.1 hypothetical protein VV02_08240 [Luteipulveratus mongoliensis]
MSPVTRALAAGVLLLSLAACSDDPKPKAVSLTSVAASPSSATSSSSSTAPGAPLRGVVVVVDPGHNGGNASHPAQVNRLVDSGFGVRKACNTTGTETNAGLSEHAQVWDVSNRLARLLRQQGATVVLTRTSDTGVGPCIDERGRAGGRAKADVMLSIHADGNNSPGVRGFHAIHAPRMAGGAPVQQASARLAVAVRDAFHKGTGMPYAGYLGGGSGLAPRTDLGTLNLSTVPSAMIESGNMRNTADAQLLGDPAFREREAAALVTGVRAFLKR